MVLLGVLFAQHAASNVRITGPANNVTGKGWDPKLNDYLIVEAIDRSGRRWVQLQIASPEWRRAAHFGQGDTPNGMKYRIYVLSTKPSCRSPRSPNNRRIRGNRRW